MSGSTPAFQRVSMDLSKQMVPNQDLKKTQIGHGDVVFVHYFGTRQHTNMNEATKRAEIVLGTRLPCNHLVELIPVRWVSLVNLAGPVLKGAGTQPELEEPRLPLFKILATSLLRELGFGLGLVERFGPLENQLQVVSVRDIICEGLHK